MDTLDQDILKYMSSRDNYFELKDVITKGLCVKESWELLTDFGEYFKQHPEVEQIDGDFKMWQRVVRHPSWKPEVARIKGAIVDSILALDIPQRSSFLETIDHLRAIATASNIAKGLEQGSLSKDKAYQQLELELRPKASDDSGPTQFSLQSLQDIHRTGGFLFRLEDLNRSIGPLRKGDFVLVVKRPEVGGTSFLVSELGYMLSQTNGNAVIFNNEEAPDKVYGRMVTSALGVDGRTLVADPARYQAEYDKWLDGSNFDLVHDTNMTIHSIHKQLESKPYDLIGINVLLKVGGTGAKEDHDKFQALGEECRRISQHYGPVMAIVQADPSAEGMQYIPMDRIYKSKTALQGEADAMIMIGTDEDIRDDTRYIYVAKNKLPPSKYTDDKLKHIKSEVAFDLPTGRFTSKNFTRHSINVKPTKEEKNGTNHTSTESTEPLEPTNES